MSAAADGGDGDDGSSGAQRPESWNASAWRKALSKQRLALLKIIQRKGNQGALLKLIKKRLVYSHTEP